MPDSLHHGAHDEERKERESKRAALYRVLYCTHLCVRPSQQQLSSHCHTLLLAGCHWHSCCPASGAGRRAWRVLAACLLPLVEAQRSMVQRGVALPVKSRHAGACFEQGLDCREVHALRGGQGSVVGRP